MSHPVRSIFIMPYASLRAAPETLNFWFHDAA